jgi:hypothetical protein
MAGSLELGPCRLGSCSGELVVMCVGVEEILYGGFD